MAKISRQQYADLYGPTTGDKIRLGDTDLYIEIEKDLRVYGEEAVYGGGKTLRDGMGYDNELTSAAGAPDLVITNVTILDAVQGVIKADVGGVEELQCLEGCAPRQRLLKLLLVDGGKANDALRAPAEGTLPCHLVDVDLNVILLLRGVDV